MFFWLLFGGFCSFCLFFVLSTSWGEYLLVAAYMRTRLAVPLAATTHKSDTHSTLLSQHTQDGQKDVTHDESKTVQQEEEEEEERVRHVPTRKIK